MCNYLPKQLRFSINFFQLNLLLIHAYIILFICKLQFEKEIKKMSALFYS